MSQAGRFGLMADSPFRWDPEPLAESIADAADSVDVAGVFRIIPQLLPEGTDVHVEGAGFALKIDAPDEV